MIEYAACLFFALAVAAMHPPAFGTAIVVAYNFLINEVFVRLTGTFDPWVWLTFMDMLSATALLVVSGWFGRTGACVAAVYVTQVIMHMAYALTGAKEPYIYWLSLTIMAFLQLAIIVTGGLCGGGRLDRLRHRASALVGLGRPAFGGSLERGEKP